MTTARKHLGDAIWRAVFALVILLVPPLSIPHAWAGWICVGLAIGDLMAAINAWSTELQRLCVELRWRLEYEQELRALKRPAG